MCGLVGVAGDISQKVKTKVFKNMLDVCQVRGRDSTGVIKVEDGEDTKKSYNTIKDIGPPSNLFDRKSYDTLLVGDAAALIGHCRSKTSGAITKENAHPFTFEDEGISGVHNGTLRSYTGLDTYKYDKVDSEVLYGHLAINGPEETFNKVEGAWACVWWDDYNETLNFIRNDERPLFFTWDKDRKQMFWASETWMFGAIERDIALWEGTEKTGKYIEMPIDRLWSFKINTKAGKDKPVITQVANKHIERKKVTPVNKYGYTYHETWHNQNSKNGWKETQGGWVKDDTKIKGGEVSDPFLNDDMPLLPPVTTAEESTTSGIGNVTYLNSSVKEQQNTQKPLLKLKKPSNFQVEKNSSCLQQETKEKLSTDVKKQSNTSLFEIPTLRKLVDRRIVAGLAYITNMITGKEMDVHEFDTVTGSCCSFCDKKISKIGEVALFLNDEEFVCHSCITPSF